MVSPHRSGSACAVAIALVLAGFGIELRGAGVPPEITAQPQPVTTFPGASFNLHVSATPSYGLRYNWRFNGTNLPASVPGQSAPLLAMTNVGLSAAGAYSVVVSNSFGVVTSATAIVTV